MLRSRISLVPLPSSTLSSSRPNVCIYYRAKAIYKTRVDKIKNQLMIILLRRLARLKQHGLY